jgi:hypothetical protein
VRAVEDFAPVEGETVAAHPETGACGADNGDQSAGPAGHSGAEADAAALEFFVADGNARRPDAGEFAAQGRLVGDGALGQGLAGLGEVAVEVARGQGGEYELAR